MSRLLCFVGIHDWHRMKHGPDLSPYPGWDCRECRRCGRFEIVAYGRWTRSYRENWDNIRELPVSGSTPNAESR